MAQEPGDAAPASAASESTPAPSASPAAPPKRARLVRQMEAPRVSASRSEYATSHRQERMIQALRVYDAALATCGAYLFRHGHYFAAPGAARGGAATGGAAPPALLPRLATSYETLSAEFGPPQLAESVPPLCGHRPTTPLLSAGRRCSPTRASSSRRGTSTRGVACRALSSDHRQSDSFALVRTPDASRARGLLLSAPMIAMNSRKLCGCEMSVFM